MTNSVLTEEQIEKLSDRLQAAIRDQLNKPFSYGVSYGKSADDLVEKPSYVESAAAFIKPAVEKYIEDLKAKGSIQAYSAVRAGSFTSSLVLKDKGRYPHHRATANFTNGVLPRTASYKGKWRRAKKLLRRWVDDQNRYLALDIDFQAAEPLIEIKFEYGVERPPAWSTKKQHHHCGNT